MISNDKLTKEQWEEIEISLSENERKICRCMLNLGSLNKNYRELRILKVTGEKVFESHIKSAFKMKFFSDDRKKETLKKSKEKGTKEGNGNKKVKHDVYNKHIQNKSKRDLLESVKSLLSTEDQITLLQHKGFGFSSEILELKLISYFVYATIHQNDKNVLFELIISMGKVIDSYQNYEGPLLIPDEETGATEGAVSPTLIKLCLNYLKYLKKKYEFSIKRIFERHPNLIYQTLLDDYFQQVDIKPFPSQKDMLTLLKKSFDETGNSKGLLLFYQTLVGSGKTSTCIALASLVLSLREKFPEKYSDLTLIFCCGVPNVRIQIGQMVYNSLEYEKNFSFAVGSSGFKQGHRVITHFSCEECKNPVLVISDLNSTLIQLREVQKKYILFLDEPTLDCYLDRSPLTDVFVRIIKHAPMWTILSSSTLPSKEKIPNVVKLFKVNHPDSLIENISCDPPKIPQQIYLDFQEKIYPHSGCKTIEELRNVVENIKTNYFIGRFYTGIYLFKLVLKLEGLGLYSKDKVEDFFDDPKHLDHKFVLEQIIQIFEFLVNKGDEKIVKKICKFKNKEYYKLVEGLESVDDAITVDAEKSTPFTNEKGNIPKKSGKIDNEGKTIPQSKSQPTPNKTNFDYKLLATTEAYRFMAGCLITIKDPLNFTMENFAPFVVNINLEKLKIEAMKTKKELQNKINALDFIKNEDERLRQIEDLKNSNYVEAVFPEHKSINLKEHFLKYNGNVLIKDPNITIQFRNDSIMLDDGKLEETNPILRNLFYAGVAVFDRNNIKDKNYNRSIRDKARIGKMAYLVSSRDIINGVNYKLNNVIIDDQFSDTVSLNASLQIMGRAGRIGKSWKSSCYVEKKLARRLFSFFRGTQRSKKELNVEAENIEKKIFENFGSLEPKLKISEKLKEKYVLFFLKYNLDSAYAAALVYTSLLQRIYLEFNDSPTEYDVWQVIKTLVVPNERKKIPEMEFSDSIVYLLGFIPERVDDLVRVFLESRMVKIYIFSIRDNERVGKFLNKYKDFREKAVIYFKPQREVISNLVYEELQGMLKFEDFGKYFSNLANRFKDYDKFIANGFEIETFKYVLRGIQNLTSFGFLDILDLKYTTNYLTIKMLSFHTKFDIGMNFFFRLMNLDYFINKFNKKSRKTPINDLHELCKKFMKFIHLDGKYKCIALYNCPIKYHYDTFQLGDYVQEFLAKFNLIKILVLGTLDKDSKKIKVFVRSYDETIHAGQISEKYKGGGCLTFGSFETDQNIFESWVGEKLYGKDYH